MERPAENALKALLGEEKYSVFMELTGMIDALYDVDRTWDKGFRDWLYEYKYRRGGKTLCTFYMKENEARFLVTLGKAERDKVEAKREEFSQEFLTVYENTPSLHDGKWLWLEIKQNFNMKDAEALLKVKRRPSRK